MFAVGTYYTPKCATAGENAWGMRRLVWWAKNSPDKENRADWVNHSGHPAGTPLWVSSPAIAYGYVAAIVRQNISTIRDVLEVRPEESLVFVPVPSSDVTLATTHTARWSGREIARRLKNVQLGWWLGPLVVNQKPVGTKTKGNDLTFDELRQNYILSEGSTTPRGRVIYIDDVLTNGTHIAALDDFLGRPPGAGAICIGTTDTVERNAYDFRYRVIVAGRPYAWVSELYGDNEEPDYEDWD